MEKSGPAPFGTLLRQFRVACGLSQEALAERARMSADGIGALERGVRLAPQRQTVSLLAVGLQLSESDRKLLEAAALPARQALRRGFTEPRDSLGDRHNLPLPLTSFFGREGDGAKLRARLSEHRLVTVTGEGGVGKTRLALETAHRLVEGFSDGVWLVEFAPLADPALVGVRVAVTLGVPQRLEAATSEVWIDEFADKELLIVLDNCEHVLDATAAIAQRVLERCPRVHILATSREPLRIRGERVYRLDALALPRSGLGALPSLDDLRTSPAIRMFFDRARDAAPNFTIADDDDARWYALQTVCARLDGMPLAIELAAARMNAMSLEMLARALDRRFDLLTAGARTALPRHKTLRALLDWSYDLLSSDERRVLRRLAVFAGGWTLEAAQSVCADDEPAINALPANLFSLVDKSLVVADTSSGAPRYGMLETTRAYALERLIERGEYDSVAHLHAEYYLRLVERANAQWAKPSLFAWLGPLELEIDNLRSALQWSLSDDNDVALAAGIAKAQHTILELLSQFAEGVQWCERALGALGPAADPALEAPLQVVLSKFYTRGGYAARGLDAANRAITLYRAMSDETTKVRRKARAALSIALGLAGRNLAFMGRHDEGDRMATESVAIARESPDVSAQAWSLYVKSLTVDAKDILTRRAVLAEALEVCRDIPESYLSGIVVIGLGHAELDAGDFQRARFYARDAIEHYLSAGWNDDLAISAFTLSAVAAAAMNDLDSAFADARDAMLHARGSLNVSVALQVVAYVATLRDDSYTAAHLVGANDGLFPETEIVNVPFSRLLSEQTLARLRESVGDAKVSAWISEGRKWSFEETLAAALRV